MCPQAVVRIPLD